MENESLSNNKFLALAIFLVSFSSFCAFLIGYGLNDGDCPPCKDKTIVKVFTTTNNVEDNVDYNMLTSEIKKDLIGKYVNQLDSESYFEIYKDGTFKFVKNSCSKYEEFTKDDYVLLMYYNKEVVDEECSILDPKCETLETELYSNVFTLIPKDEITTENLVDSILTFKDSESTETGVSVKLLGPTTCSKSNMYIKVK